MSTQRAWQSGMHLRVSHKQARALCAARASLRALLVQAPTHPRHSDEIQAGRRRCAPHAKGEAKKGGEVGKVRGESGSGGEGGGKGGDEGGRGGRRKRG